jgi:GPI-anchor transamidase subunit S
MSHAEALTLLRLTQINLDDLDDFSSAHHLRLKLSESGSSLNRTYDGVQGTPPDEFTLENNSEGQEDIALTVRLIQGEAGSTPSATLQSYVSQLDVFYTAKEIPSVSSTSSPLATFIANKLQEIFAEEQAIVGYIMSHDSPSQNGQATVGTSGQTSLNTQSTSTNGRDARPKAAKAVSAEFLADLSRRTTRAVKYSPTYHLTFSLFTPTAAPSSWEIESAIDQYLYPLLESLQPISNFTVDTQVQLYASLSPSVQEPEYDPVQQQYTIRREDLSGFINAAEWPLSPSIGGAPTINFVVYVPAPSKSPLVVKENRGSSWLIPQWGGITILNTLSPDGGTVKLTAESLRPALLTFSHQLLSLLGTPQTPSSLPLQLLTLTRVQSASLLLSASSTLGSLSRLTHALPSISIPPSVAHSVDATLAHLRLACSDLQYGRFHSALKNARIAEAEAEKGFFEKSMVGQVYFPDEHKVAVYLPLLGPIGVSLFMAAVKEIRRAVQAWKSSKR